MHAMAEFLKYIWTRFLEITKMCNNKNAEVSKTIKPTVTSVELDDPTNHTLKQVLTTGMIFNYEYDFGSTTEIMVKVLDHYSAQKQNEKVVILSRNNPPEFACSICGNSRSLKRERFFH